MADSEGRAALATPGSEGARLRHALRTATSPRDARSLAAMARSLAAPSTPLRLAIVHSYTSDLLDPWLDAAAAIEGFELAVHHAPYGLALGEAVPGSALARFAPDLTLFLVQREDFDPRLALPLPDDPAELDGLADTLAQQLADYLQAFRAVLPGQLIVALRPSLVPSDLGLYDALSGVGEQALAARLRARATELLRESLPGTAWLDLDEVVASVGRRNAYDARLWHMARFPFAAPAAAELSLRLMALAVAAKRTRAKVIALDADNTLWGGVIGEDGIDGIALGPDYPGSAYVEFQRRIMGLQRRGFILALVSKNNEADVLEVLRNHPHMLLREDSFAAMRVNWSPKADNLRELAEELQLGLDSFVFVDDSDYEVGIVRQELPMVEVVQTPSRPVDVPACLDGLPRLEILALTAEDRRKTAMYAAERERRALRRTMEGAGVDLASYLRSLDMRMSIGIDSAAHVRRLSQLTQKTNQFNLTTRRYDEAEVAARIADPAWLVAHFSLADRFGDSGIVGLAMVHRDGAGSAHLDTFLMSCRVIGRDAEAAFLAAILRRLAAQGIRSVTAEFIPTAKNALAAGFLPSQGFEPVESGQFRLDLLACPPPPAETFPIAIDQREG